MIGAARFRCPGCGYVYDEARGDAHEGFVAGTRWTQIPESWACPNCAVREKPDFEVLAESATAREGLTASHDQGC